MNILKHKTGKVYLVGAGPSDAELLTIKAQRLLKEADVIVYDHLVGAAILSMIPEDAKRIDVGKRAGNHTKSQEEINRILCDLALEGKKVIRLKGGDPFLFGRGGEELELLIENDIPFEIVPGVTSAISVPAYSGIPVTHRDYTSSLHIITGHKRAGKSYDLPFRAYVESKGTLVFLMGLGALPDIVRELKNAGMEGSTSTAVLQKGTTACQKKVISDLDHIEEEVKREGIRTPAIIVVGAVCDLAEKYEWYEDMPLFGRRMYVTRPKDRSSSLTGKLRALGAEVVELPSIRTIERPVNDEIRNAYEHIGEYQYILFTSPYGVKIFLKQLRELRMDIRRIGPAKIGAIGKATANALESAGLIADYVPVIFSGAELGRLIGSICQGGDRILLPRASIGTEDVVTEILREKKVHITDLPIYDTEYISNPEIFPEEESEPYVFFTSASTVRGFVSMMPDYPFDKVIALCIGEQTAKEASRHQMKCYVSESATIDSLVDLAVNLNKEQRG